MNVGITALLHQQGRRVILVFTDGVDSPMTFSNTNSSLKDVMKRAEEEDVMVYAIGPGFGGFGGGYGGFGRQGAADEKPDEGLSKIAAVTGGGYFELTSTSDLFPPSPGLLTSSITNTRSVSRRRRSTAKCTRSRSGSPAADSRRGRGSGISREASDRHSDFGGTPCIS